MCLAIIVFGETQQVNLLNAILFTDLDRYAEWIKINNDDVDLCIDNPRFEF